MKVLMFGWEFPPYFAGGVGTVCEQLSKALADKDVEITFVMPKGPDEVNAKHLKLLVADKLVPNSKINIKPINSMMKAYQSFNDYETSISNHLVAKGDGIAGELYGSNLLEEVRRFAAKAKLIAQETDFDIIHAHDWTTFPAAIAAAQVSGKPLITHMHITEFDKTGGLHADPRVYAIEKEGMDKSDMIIAVSNKIKDRCINQYFQNPEKIQVIHNGAELTTRAKGRAAHIKGNDDLVLFTGRVTLQKGPDYFVEMAKKILEHKPNTKFVMAGSGDMLQNCISRAAELGISNKFLFHGFYTREEGDEYYQIADLYVMPSVSEPFGLVPLEAMYHDTPVIVSKQSGISEVITNCFKCDFWDVDDMAAKAIAALSYPSMKNHMSSLGKKELNGMTWEKPATQCIDIYNKLNGA